MMEDASVASWIVRPGPPMIFINTPFAPSIEDSSSSGLETAFWADSTALFSPLPIPVPISACPIPVMIAFTSAKSRLTRHGMVINSDMPFTDCLKTSSATLNASLKDICFETTLSNLSFGIVISVSTFSLSSFNPASACDNLLFPSKLNGFVTTPTVNAPLSFAIFATTGAAPVPVPPPIPAVTKTISAPSNKSAIWSALSNAAFFPISGLPPAPSPLVNSEPIWIFVRTGDTFNTCASVFTTIKSTPSNFEDIIVLTALPPPPPTPITLSFAELLNSSDNSNVILLPSHLAINLQLTTYNLQQLQL